MAPTRAVSRVNQPSKSGAGARQRKQQQQDQDEDSKREQIILEDNEAAYQSYLGHVKKKNGGRALIMPPLPDNMLAAEDDEELCDVDIEFDNHDNNDAMDAAPDEALESPPQPPRPKKARSSRARPPAVRRSKTSPAGVARSLPLEWESDDSLALNAAEPTGQQTPQLRNTKESKRLQRYSNSLIRSLKAAQLKRTKKVPLRRSASAGVTPSKQPRPANNNAQLQAIRRRLAAHAAFESASSSDEAPQDAYFPDKC